MFFVLFLNSYRKILILLNSSSYRIFNPIAELIIPIGTPGKEAKEEIEIHPVNAEAKIRKCSM